MNLEVQLIGRTCLAFCAEKDAEVLLRSSGEPGMSAKCLSVAAIQLSNTVVTSYTPPKST